MDPERQPLLRDNVRCQRFRPLTYDEVLASRHNFVWRRSRLIIMLIFWSTMVMFLSIVACLLMKSNCYLKMEPGVPPVHLTLAPLIASGRIKNEAYIT
ncbi:uncharacterized protein isoform X2 [Choristoneura fumiferana]|uniref:uncharacterized protein isoform X2 n=1 Tax=Choristoneura fumiferana TaxID=7141 RepID=UPI003D156145